MSAPTFPIDFVAIRKALVAEVKRVTRLECIVEEPKTQNSPRPALPYFSFKLLTPAAKSGDDAQSYDADTGTFNVGGQREMTVSFHCYTEDEGKAYDYMALWQASLQLYGTQASLRTSGIAVWLIGDVDDLSQLLNTGYEGRSHMDVRFGIASNLSEAPGFIETAEITGTVDTGVEDLEVEFDAP